MLGTSGIGLLVGCSLRGIAKKDSASIDTLVLDFDGTLTNIEEEAKPYVDGFCQSLGRELKLSQSEVETYWQEARTKIFQSPEEYGWKLDGRIVASATSDPIMTCYPITDEILGKLGITLSQQERRALFAKLYLENYSKMGGFFKEGADDFLSEVWDLFKRRVYVVTNTSTEKVEKKISNLPSDHSRILIRGGAKKYEVVDDWEAVPKTINVLGLDRPVYLRRQPYWEALDKIAQEQRTDLSRIAVVGDIWELDLALPQYLGAVIGLTPHLTTPQFEKDVVANYKRGFLAENLTEVSDNLKERV